MNQETARERLEAGFTEALRKYERAEANEHDPSGEAGRVTAELRQAAYRAPSTALAGWLHEEADRVMHEGEWSEHALAYAREVAPQENRPARRYHNGIGEYTGPTREQLREISLRANRAARELVEFEITPLHLDLLRRAHVDHEDEIEFGAPRILPKRPYGNTVNQDLADIAEERGDDIESIAWAHGELATALQIAVAFQAFEPGVYVRETQYSGWQRPA